MTDQDEDQQALCDEVAAISAELVEVDGDVLLYEDDFERWRDDLTALPPARHEGICLDLVALATKLERLGGGAVDNALRQLMELCGALLGSEDAAESLFDAAGVELERGAATVTGAAPVSKMPVSTGDPAGEGTLFALRLGKKSK